MKAQQTTDPEGRDQEFGTSWKQYFETERTGSNLARYWTVPVSVILELGSYALVRRGDGLSFIVETRDLEHWPRGH